MTLLGRHLAQKPPVECYPLNSADSTTSKLKYNWNLRSRKHTCQRPVRALTSCYKSCTYCYLLSGVGLADNDHQLHSLCCISPSLSVHCTARRGTARHGTARHGTAMQCILSSFLSLPPSPSLLPLPPLPPPPLSIPIRNPLY